MISDPKDRNYSLLILIVAYLILTMPVALRYYTGADYSAYVQIYGNVKALGINDVSVNNIEIGYLLLNYICIKLFNDVQAVFIIMALLTNYFFFKGIIYESKKISLGLAIFAYGFTIYFWDYIIIRNMLGIALIFYGLRFIFERKLVKYFLVVTVAVLFHTSLVIFYSFGILYMEKLKKYRIPLAVLSVLLIPIIPTVIKILGTNLSAIWLQFSNYNSFLSQIKFHIGKFVLAYALPLIPFSIFYKKLNKLNSHNSLYLSFYIISIVVLSFAATMPILTRYVYALWPSQIILFSSFLHIFDDISEVRKKFIVQSSVITLIFIYGIVLIIYFINQAGYFLIPYQSIFGI